MAEYGTLADFDRLLEALHDRGIRLIMDLVINHSSDEHPWFLEARSDRNSPYHDYYIWKAGRPDQLPNNWPSFFGGPAWTWNEATGEYYLHLFSPRQPDCNWTNDALREELKKIIRFWAGRGVDGFRFDAVNHLAKDLTFPDGEVAPGETYGNFFPYVQNRPEVHGYTRELRRDAILSPDIFVAGEAGSIGFEQAAIYTAADAGELDLLFHFDMHSVGRGPKDWIWVPADLRHTIKKSFSGWSRRPPEEGWNPVFFSNNDSSRTVSRIGDETYREMSAKALCLLQMTQRGTPFNYYGDEIGMTNARNFQLEDYRDVAVLEKYRDEVLEGGVDPADYLEGLRHMNRDNARPLMQWEPGPGAGFSKAMPWIPFNSNYRAINAAEQEKRSDSILAFYRRMISLRKDDPALIYGDFTEYLAEHPQIYLYTRREAEAGYLVLLNLTSEPAQGLLPEELADLAETAPELLITNHPGEQPLERHLALDPWEARLYRISPR